MVSMVHCIDVFRCPTVAPLCVVYTDTQVPDPTLLDIIHPSVETHQLRLATDSSVFGPRRLDNITLRDMCDLRSDVRFDEFNRCRRTAGTGRHVLGKLSERREPAPEGRRRGCRCRGGGRCFETCGDTTAVGVADNDDVFDAELGDGVCQHGENAVVVEVDLAVGSGRRAGRVGVAGIAGYRVDKVRAWRDQR